MNNFDLPTIFNAILDPSGLQVWIKDVEGRYIQASTAWSEARGVTSRDIRGLTDFDLVNPEAAEDYRRTDDIVRTSGKPLVFESSRAVNGIWSESVVQKFPLHDASGNVTAIGGIATDVGEINALRRDLVEKLSLIEGIYNATSHGIARMGSIKDDTGEVVDLVMLEANASACKLAKRERDELIGMRLSELTEPQNMGRFIEAFLRSRSERQPVTFVLDGAGASREITFSFTINALDDELVITTTDISQDRQHRKRLDETVAELERERSKYRALYRKAPVMLQSLDPDRGILEVSDRWLQTLGYERSEVLGKRPTEFITPESDRLATEQYVPRFWREGYINDAPVTFVTRQGETVETEISSVVDEDEDGQRTMSVVIDVTERNRARDDLRMRNRQLQASYERLSQFTTAASHDLNEPLRKIVVYADMLTEALENGESEDIDRAIEVIKSTARRGRDLVSDLLSFSRISDVSSRKSRVEIGEIVKASVDGLSALAADSNADLRFNLTDAVIDADPTQVSQLVTNLLANALTYSRDSEPPGIAVSTVTRGSQMALSVSDNGIGIEPDNFEMIFEPFKRLHTREEYPGTGLGLSICKMICERHGWEIDVNSAFGEGACFTVTIPLAA